MTWYQVLVVRTDGDALLIAIEARSADEAREIIAKDWGAESIREVTLL